VTDWPDLLNIDNYFLRDRLGEGLGDHVALRLDDRNVTYREVDRASSGLAALLSDAGAGPGDRVMIVLPDGLEFVSALFAVFRIGAVAVMLNPDLTEEAMGAIIHQARASATVVHALHLDVYRKAAGEHATRPHEIVVREGMSIPEGDVQTVDTRAGDAALWLFSGGTTGLPKAVVQTHRSFANTAELYGRGSLGLTQVDITISVPKLYFGYATGSNLFFPFLAGGSAVLFAEPPTAGAILDRVARHQATVLINVPSAINQMLNHPGASAADLSSLRLATSAGEALPETLYHRWKTAFGVEMLDGLGTAEMWHIFITNTAGDVRPGTLGKVVPGFEIKACDEAGEEVPSGEVGRLWVRGDSLGLGYWESPEQTKEAFRGEWFVGGDLVSIDEDGYVTHRGRADDAIKVKGKWFRPQEVESSLLDHPSVKECAVVAVTHSSGLARPVAFVVPLADVSEQELIDWVLARLEAYKHPRRVYVVDALPQTHLGKTDRAALRRMAK
jgi:benzoate-CoA ligase family protein